MLYKLYNFEHFKCKIGEQKCPGTFNPIYKYDEAVPLWMKRQKIGQSVNQGQQEELLKMIMKKLKIFLKMKQPVLQRRQLQQQPPPQRPPPSKFL